MIVTNNPSVSTTSEHSTATTLIPISGSSPTTEDGITTAVAPLAGVIGLLIILLMGLCGFFLSFYIYTRKHRHSLLEAPQNHKVNNLNY